MAKIFISYSSLDIDLVTSFTEQLRKLGHEILLDSTVIHAGDKTDKTLHEALRNTDGTIVLLTTNSYRSKNVQHEVRIARAYYDSKTDKKFLIPLTSGKPTALKILDDLQYLHIEERSVSETVAKIDEAIKDFLDKNKSSQANSSINEVLKRVSKDPTFKQQLEADAITTLEQEFNEPLKQTTSGELKINSSGKKVKEIQTALNRIGLFKSTVDGFYGPATEAAVRKFQTEYELEITGEVDEKTYNVILSQAERRNNIPNDHYYSLSNDDQWAKDNGYTLVGIAAFVPRKGNYRVFQNFDSKKSLHRVSDINESYESDSSSVYEIKPKKEPPKTAL